MASNKPVRWPTEIIKQSAPWLSVFNKRSAKTPVIAESKDVSSAIQLPPVPITAGSPRHYSGWNPTVTPAHSRLAGCRRNGGSHRDFFTLPARRKFVRKLDRPLTYYPNAPIMPPSFPSRKVSFQRQLSHPLIELAHVRASVAGP